MIIRNSLLFLLLLIGIATSISAQEACNENKYWVYFKDKTQKELALTERSLERRWRQGISTDLTDYAVNRDYVNELEHWGEIDVTSRWLNAVSIALCAHDIPKIKALPFVLKVQYVQRFKLDIEPVTLRADKAAPSKQLRRSNSTFFDYGEAIDQVRMLGLESLHNAGYTGENMLIAVMDGGFRGVDEGAVFDRLRNRKAIVATRDLVNSGTVYESSTHGSKVLSCMGGYFDGGLVGTAPNADYILLRTEDVASETLVEEDNWVAAVEFADSLGADISNTSLGYSTFDDQSTNHTYSDLNGNSTIITLAADMAAKKGMLVVNSAGNSGANAWRYITAPSDGDSVLAVGAVNKNNTVVSFSSRGPSPDGRVKPNVCALGLNATVSSSGGDTISRSNGTSFSSPILAGAAACLWQANIDHSNMDVFYAIEESGHVFCAPNDSMGFGIPNMTLADSILKRLVSIECGVFSGAGHLQLFRKGYAIGIDFGQIINANVEIRLFNSLGQQLYKEDQMVSGQERQILFKSMSGQLAPGVYILSVAHGDIQQSAKFIWL